VDVYPRVLDVGPARIVDGLDELISDEDLQRAALGAPLTNEQLRLAESLRRELNDIDAYSANWRLL
jgi:hypothetical protein